MAHMLEVILALLAKEPAHGYELRARLAAALGPMAGAVSSGQVYVTLGRLERSELVAVVADDGVGGADRKVYEVTAAGTERLAEWAAETAWRRVAPMEFHLRLVATAAAHLGDPLSVIDRHRRELLRQLRVTQQVQLDEPVDSIAALLLEGTALRLQADLRWLEDCTRHWTSAAAETGSGR
jgi:DNA-binding PadR family transcriptional regulator